MVQFDILTLFPEMFQGFLKNALIAKAIEKGLLAASIHDLRQFSQNTRGDIDDRPYGGGEGMVLSPEPLSRALESVRDSKRPTIFLTPQGNLFKAQRAQKMVDQGGAILLCGRYAGIDERIRQNFIDEELSIGDFVLMGGELPAMVVLEASARFIPGVVGNSRSVQNDSFQQGLLEGPQYTRPQVFLGQSVPDVLLSGNHREIETWRKDGALKRTLERRPDLVKKPLQE